MRHGTRPEEFFGEIFRRAYHRWQQAEEEKDARETTSNNKLLIENGDPELEEVIGALEQGWNMDEGRS